MQDSKLITILKTLTAEEFYKFHEYVISPFFNKNKNITLLFNFIKKYYPKFSNNNFTKEKGFAYIFPGEKFNDSKLRVLMAKLLNLLEDYLAFLLLSKDKSLKSLSILKMIRYKKLIKYYEGYNDAAKKTLDSFPYRNYNYFYYNYEYFFEYYNYAVVNDKGSDSILLQKLSDSLDLFYLNKKLSFSADMVQREYFLSSHFRKPFLNYLIKYLKKLAKISKKDLTETHPYLAIYFYYNLLFTGESEETNYKKIMVLLEKNAGKFEPFEAYYLYTLLTNFLNLKSYRGEIKYIKDLFKIYKHLLTTKFFFKRNALGFIDYHNIANTAFELKKYSWAKDFLNEYKSKLEPEYRDNLFNLELAWLNYYTKQYDNALKNLSKIELTDYNFYLDSRRILTKIYYETGEIKGMFPLLDSFRHYLTRNKLLSKELKKSFLNYIVILNKLFRVKIGEKDNLTEIKKMIKETQNLDAKNWLMEKVKELE